MHMLNPRGKPRVVESVRAGFEASLYSVVHLAGLLFSCLFVCLLSLELLSTRSIAIPGVSIPEQCTVLYLSVAECLSIVFYHRPFASTRRVHPYLATVLHRFLTCISLPHGQDQPHTTCSAHMAADPFGGPPPWLHTKMANTEARMHGVAPLLMSYGGNTPDLLCAVSAASPQVATPEEKGWISTHPSCAD